MDFAILALLIMIPAVFVVALFWSQHYEIDESGNKRLKPFLTLFELDATIGASNQKLLWMSILVPAAYFVEFGFFAWRHSLPDYSPEGFIQFLKISSLPIGLLSLSLPLSLLVLRLHSTKQTAEQIKITRAKNNADAFYSHRKAMIEYFALFPDKQYSESFRGRFAAHPRLHMSFFGSSSMDSGVQSIDREKLNECISLLSMIQKNSLDFLSVNNDISVREVALIRAFDFVYMLAGRLCMSVLLDDLRALSSSVLVRDAHSAKKDKEVIFVGDDSLTLVAVFLYQIDYLEILFNFSGSAYDFSEFKEIQGRVLSKSKTLKHPYTGAYAAVLGSIASKNRAVINQRNVPM